MVADSNSVDAGFSKPTGRLDAGFFLIEAPCIRLGARIAACLRSNQPYNGLYSAPYPTAAIVNHGEPIGK